MKTHLKLLVAFLLTFFVIAAVGPVIRKLDDLVDVRVSTPVGGQALVFNGTVWTNGASSNGFDTVTITNLNVFTQTVDIEIISNAFFLSGKASLLIVTQYVRMPYATLTMSGSNVSTVNLASNTFFKLTLTNDGYITTPTGLPGVTHAQTIQIMVVQDGTGGRTLTWTNGSWKFPGGTAPTMSSAANAVDIYTFVNSPFNAAYMLGVQTADIK